MEQEEVVRRLERLRDHYRWLVKSSKEVGNDRTAIEWQKDVDALNAAVYICRGES